MEGYMEIRTKKLLKSNKKFWFVLGQNQLEYYNDREDACAELGPQGQIAMCDVLDVHVAQDHRNTITLVRRGKENLKLKVRGGQAHNWLGNIRERIFCAREGDVPLLRKKKRRAVRSVSKTYEDELSLLAKQAQSRCSRSTNDLSQLLSMRAAEEDSCSDGYNESFNHDQLSLASSFRSRNTSISSSSIFSGSSISSRGSLSHFKKKPRLPVSGFTGRAFLANEKKMVEEAGVIVNEDLEYIVQAERDASPSSDMATDDDVNKENKKEMGSRNVRFNTEQEIYVIGNEISNNKFHEPKKSVTTNDKDTKSQSSRRRTSSFVWGKIRIGKNKNCQSPEIMEHKACIPEIDKSNKESDSASELNKDDVTIQNMKNNSEIDRSDSNKEGDAKSDSVLNSDIDGKDSEIESQNKSDKNDDKIQLRCEQQISSPLTPNLESSFQRPRFYTESHKKGKELGQDDQLRHSSHRLDHVKRERRTSLTSTNSRDSLGSMNSSGMKDRIFYWKRSSSRSLKSVTISNPMTTEDQKREGTTTNDINSQIDQIANDRLEAVFKLNKSLSEDDKNPCRIPKKPLKFHMKQLEKLLTGCLNPPPSQNCMSEIQLRLDSMLVMLSLSCETVAPPGEVYDVPRLIQIVQ